MVAGKNSFSPFVVSFGGENFHLDRDLDRARHWTGRRPILLDGSELTDSALVSICETYSDEPRTIIVDYANKVKGDKALKPFIEGRSVNDTSLILVAIIRSEKLPEVWSAALSKGKGYERKKLKPWNTKEYLNWIKLEADRLRVTIDDGVAQALLQCVGPDLYRLCNEIRKLAIYVGAPGKILKEHISLVTTPTPQADPYQVAEATIAKDVRAALVKFSYVYRNSGDECLIPVVRALMKQLEKTAIIRGLMDKGTPDDEIAALVGMKEWPFRNIAAPIARKHELRSLVQHMGRLCKLDADVKGPARSKRTLVELAMLTIAR